MKREPRQVVLAVTADIPATMWQEIVRTGGFMDSQVVFIVLGIVVFLIVGTVISASRSERTAERDEDDELEPRP